MTKTRPPSPSDNTRTALPRHALGETEAVSMLPDGDMIHTFRCDNFNMLFGCDMDRSKIVELIQTIGAELSGPMATAMHHGIHIKHGGGNGLFVATREPEPESSLTTKGET